MLIRADSTRPLPLLPGSVDAVVTSPPYFGLRRYGDSDSELGSDEDLPTYLDRLVSAFNECRYVMSDRGLLMVNIADTASKSGGAGGDYNRGGSKEGRRRWCQGETYLPPMTWCNVGGKLVEAMLADGWLLRSEIVWDKGVERAEALPHVRRVRPAHEMIYLFSQHRDYRFNHEALAETGSVWHFSPSARGGKGPAPFPDELAARCIACTTWPGDTVLDPFAGSGTTVSVAERMGRRGVGIDIYAGRGDYAASWSTPGLGSSL